VTDDKPPCTDCKHHALHRPAFLRTSLHADVCTHPSALRINEGSVWHIALARQRCKGRRHERKRV